MKKWKDLTPAKKESILKQAKDIGIYPTVNSLKEEGIKVWPDTLKYQIDFKEKQKKQQTSKKIYHDKLKNNKDYKKKKKAYDKQRRELGISRKKWKEWWNSLSLEEQEKRKQSTKQHRLDNIKHYKARSKRKYQLYMESTTLEERRARRNKTYTREKKDGYNKKCREKYNNDPVYKLKCLIRSHICRATFDGRKKLYASKEYLGCEIDEFRDYIEKKFKQGMTWENHGRGEGMWHLDHVIPLSWSKDISEEDLKKLCHYTNYQPLWETDNLKKSTIIEYPFFSTDEELRKEYKTIQNKEGSYDCIIKNNKNILHFQPHFYEREIRMLNEEKDLRERLLKNRSKYLNKPEGSVLVEELIRGLKISGEFYGYSHFPYQVMKKFISDYSPQCIYDPCGGWGHRLLAAGNIPYIYNDVWEDTVLGIHEMVEFHNIQNKTIYNQDCTKFTPKEQYDTIFTCPPYYNTEVYGNGEFKSVEDYNLFLREMLDNSIISNVKNVGIVIGSAYVHYLEEYFKSGYTIIPLRKNTTHFTRKLHQRAGEVLLVKEMNRN